MSFLQKVKDLWSF